jgi:hypothetical protein
VQVTNATWQQVGDPTPTTLTVQNVGFPRIAYVFAAAQPGVSDITLDSDEHFILLPGQQAISFANLSTEGLTMWARALGPSSAELAVSSYVAP